MTLAGDGDGVCDEASASWAASATVDARPDEDRYRWTIKITNKTDYNIDHNDNGDDDDDDDHDDDGDDDDDGDYHYYYHLIINR